MNATLLHADASTHLKIVALSLLGATVVIWLSVLAN
jgi:hypothetical protein